MAKKSKNYMDCIPKRKESLKWELNDNGMVVLLMEHRGFYNKIAQTFFKKPRVSRIDLDKMGSFIWQEIDGEKTVYDIAQKVKTKFGAEAEPLYDRLVKYLRILQNNAFITIK